MTNCSEAMSVSDMQSVVRSIWRATSGVKVNGMIPIVKYVSQRSGLRVTIADVPGPMVNGILSFVTEADSDDGLPHTLEHLVFMGSERYPYKGVLDILANRCLASGTNAWTEQDHTAYTLGTVGEEGFLKMLPVYMDHVLSPTLSDEQFTTEVHHINGEGEDAGVVYCEMQDYESDISWLVTVKRKELFYPDKCSYRVNTGGRLENLRSSCNNEKVRVFHRQYYDPCNMTVIVCGQIDHERVLAAVESAEEHVLQDPLRTEIRRKFSRPFQSPIEPLKQSVDALILCPSDDESSGVVQLSWIGPPANDYYKAVALDVLFGYMQSTAVSPLQRDFVQLAEPFCSDISFDCLEQSVGEIVLSLEGVPTDKLTQIRPRLFEKTIAELLNRDPIAFDMERLHFVIDQAIRKSLSKLETKPHDTIGHMVIGDQLYGESEADFKARMNDVDMYEKARSEPPSFWVDLLNEFLGPHRPYVCVVGQPSAECVEKVAEAEDNRLEEQQDRLGEEGLRRCAENLENAVAANLSKQPPESVLNEFIVRNFDGFNSFKVTETSNLLPQSDSNPHFNLASLPFGATVHDCKTNFVDVVVVMDTSQVPEDLRPWLMLWFELMFESPAEIDGHYLPYEEVTKRFTGDLVSQSIGLGVNGAYNRLVSLRVKVDQRSYNKAAKWVKTFLKGVRFDADRVRVTAQKLANEAAAAKREGNDVSRTLLTMNIYQPGSNGSMYNLIRLESFHGDVAAAAELRPNEVVAKLEKLRELVTSPDNTTLHISCDVDALHAVVGQPLADVWKNVLDTSKDSRSTSKRPQFDPHTREPLFLNDAGFGSALISPVGASESGFLNQVAKFIDDCLHEDLAATLLLLQYLSQTEGPLWRNIRGKGLAYGANIYAQPEKGLITLSLYRSAQLVQAYQETAQLIADVLSSKHELVETEFEAAKRSLVFEVVAQEQTVKAACDQATMAYYRRVPLDYNRQLTRRIWAVQQHELREKGAKYLAPLFDFATAATAIAVHPSKLDEVTSGFQKLGRTLENISLDSERVCVRYGHP